MARPLACRAGILLWSVLMLALPAAEAAADARIAAQAGDVREHVEDASRPDCPRVHAHDCAICQHLTTVSLPAARSALPVTDAGPAGGPADHDPARGARWAASGRPRAPPARG